MDITALRLNQSKVQQFQQKGINTVEDLLNFYPRKYIDYRFPKKYLEFTEGENVSVLAMVLSIRFNSMKKYWKANVMDSDRRVFDIYWFGNPYGINFIKEGQTYLFCGKATRMSRGSDLVLSSPLWTDNPKSLQIMYPCYSKIRGMSDQYLKSAIAKALASYVPNDTLDPEIVAKYGLCFLSEKYAKYHHPSSPEDIQEADRRETFEELFHLAIEMERTRIETTKPTRITVPSLNSIKPFMGSLPFALTDGEGSQLETIRGIIRKINHGKLTTSLIEGDVGTGKTIVAVALMLAFAENGYQSTLMAPTNILASQHYEEVCGYAERCSLIKPILLSGKMTAKAKKTALEKIKNGEANFIIGTHSIANDGVEFKNLGLCIIDEEHRFGVAQRDKIRGRITSGVHAVSMSATPIPRTLGRSLYGDEVDIYTITQKPEGRKPVITTICSDSSVGYEKIREEVAKGRQAYIVCPIIEESESEKMENVESVEEVFDNLRHYFFDDPDIKPAMVNGKMKPAEINDVVSKFVNKEYNVIVSTTIIEVGVNVPNASVIMVQNAERFGLAQLHQLRGRVGRGASQSYCVLCSPVSDVERLTVMTQTTDGFKIAEEDLRLRGMGDFLGTKQSGDIKNIMLMLANRELYFEIKKDVRKMIAEGKAGSLLRF